MGHFFCCAAEFELPFFIAKGGRAEKKGTFYAQKPHFFWLREHLIGGSSAGRIKSISVIRPNCPPFIAQRVSHKMECVPTIMK